jgi:DNA-binding transcriptional regulator PaaX
MHMPKSTSKRITYEILFGIDWLLADATRSSLHHLLGHGADSFQRQLYRLEEQELISKAQSDSGNWVYSLTERGRQLIQRGQDPTICWDKPWDGVWQLLLLDLARANHAQRKRLWRLLKSSRFGCLQRSVWLAPEVPSDLMAQLTQIANDPKSVVLMETRFPQGSQLSDQELAESVWDFDAIQLAFREHKNFLNTFPGRGSDSTIVQWLLLERDAWKKTLEKDPFLPRTLYPKSYLGFEVDRKRSQILDLARKSREA